MRFTILVCLLLILALPCMAQAPSVTLAWDLSTSEPLGTGGGYECFTSKQSMNYASVAGCTVAPGISTCVMNNLPYGKDYFACRAFVGDGTRSDWSNEVDTTIKPKPPKVNAVTQIANVFKGAVTAVAGIFTPKKNLRIVH